MEGNQPRKKAKILMLLDAPYPADIRVEKEASALIQHGFSVSLMCVNKGNQVLVEEIDQMRLIRVRAGSSNFVKAFWDVIVTVFKIHPVFYGGLKKLLAKEKFDVIHVHDLPLAGTALAFQPQAKIVLDFHENYPQGLAVWFKWKTNPIARMKNSVFMNYKRWISIEEWASQKADYIIAVVDEMKSRLITDYQLEEKKIKVITNTEYKAFGLQPVDTDALKAYDGKFKIVYTGGVGPHRGIDTVIRAMQKIPDQFVLIVAGKISSPSVKNHLCQLIREENVEHKVVVSGYLPFNQFLSYMIAADVNIIPHNRNGHTDNTIPHKLFQAMYAKRPVVVSSCQPLQRIVEETGAGYVFEADNPFSLANLLRWILEHEEDARSKAMNGYKAVQEGNYNWEYTGKQLANFYQQIL